MDTRSVLGRVGTVAVVCLVVLVAGGALFGQPILLSFVTSDSMSPDLTTGDGFVVTPSALAGDVGPGDVVVFDAERLEGGGLVTHRIVGETAEGFLTKGDANALSDQQSGEPPVKPAQIRGVVLQVDGRPIALPYVGTTVEGVSGAIATAQSRLAAVLGTSSVLGVRGLAYLFFAASLVWYGVGAWRASNSRPRSRSTGRETGQNGRAVLGLCLAVVVVAATVGMLAPAGPQKFEVISAEFDSPGARVIPAGETETTTYPIGNGGVLPIVTVLDGGEGVTVSPREHYVEGQHVKNATVTLSAPPETGAYRRYVTEHRYLALLPQTVIHDLYAVHPLAPIVAIDALLVVVLAVLGGVFVGTGRIRTRSRDGPGGTPISRLRRWLW